MLKIGKILLVVFVIFYMFLPSVLAATWSYEQFITIRENQSNKIQFIVTRTVDPPSRYANEVLYFPNSWGINDIKVYDFQNFSKLETTIIQSNNLTYLFILYPSPLSNETYKYVIEFEQEYNVSFLDKVKYGYNWVWGNFSSEIQINLTVIFPPYIVIDSSNPPPTDTHYKFNGTEVFYIEKSLPNKFFDSKIYFHKFQEPNLEILINSVDEKILEGKPFVVSGYLIHHGGDEISNLVPKLESSAFFNLESEISITNTTLANRWAAFQFRLKPIVASDNAPIGTLLFSYKDTRGYESKIKSEEIYLKIFEDPKLEFWIGSVGIPILLFVLGFVVSELRHKRK